MSYELRKKENMNDQETLINDVKEKTSNGTNFLSILSSITVEPILIMATFIMGLYSTLSKEYIFHYYAVEYGIENTTSSSGGGCNQSSHDNGTYSFVASETSKWTLYLNCAGMVASCFSSTLLGVWGDIVGRKPVLMISSLSFVVLQASYCVVVQFSLPIYFLLIGRLLTGLMGDFACIIGTCFAFMSDISTDKERTFRLGIAEASLGIGGVIAFFLSGILLENIGFLKSFYALLALSFSMTLYISVRFTGIFRVTKQSVAYLVKLLPLKDLYFSAKSCFTQGVILTLVLLLTCFGLNFIFDVGINNVLLIYILSGPYCFSETLVGYVYALCNAGLVTNIFILHFSKSIKVEFLFIMISAIAMIVSSTLLAFSGPNWMIYTSLVVKLFSMLIAPILRSQSSKLVSRNTQGALFSIIASMEAILALVASVLFNGIYSKTALTDKPGLVFLIGTVCGVIIIPLYLIAYYKAKDVLSYSAVTPQQLNSCDSDDE